MKTVRTVGFILAFFLIVIGIGWGGKALSIIEKRVFGAWEKDVERQVLKESRSQVDGVVEDIERYKLKYDTNPERRASYRRMIIKKAREIDIEDMPEETQEIVREMRREERNSLTKP